MPPSTKKRSPTLQTIVLTQNAEIKPLNLPVQEDGTITIQTLKPYWKKKDPPELVGSYKSRLYTLYLFGFLSGKAGTENKHELPPPHDSILCFGDILVIASKDSKRYTNPIPFTVEEYESFYTKLFEGFEDLEDEDAEEAEEEEAEVEEEAEAEAEEEEEPEDEEEEEEAEAEEAEEEAGVEAEAEDGDIPVKKAVAKPPRKRTAKPVVNDVFATNAAPSCYGFITVPPEEQLQPETSISNPTEPHRISILNSLRALFVKPKLSENELLDLERAIYNGALLEADRRHVTKVWIYMPFVHIYKMHARHIASNFHPESYVNNKDLFEMFRAGGLSMDTLSTMDSYTLFQKRWQENFEQQQSQEKRQLEGNKAMATDQFLCTRCWKRECTYYEMQTRSADEPMTIFITCLNCGKHWRQ